MESILINGLSFAAPLFIIAIGGVFSEKSGITNLALEGLQGFGAFTGAIAAVFLADAGPMTMYLAMLAAMIGGAVYACIHAMLCIRFKANQVVSGVVVNILSVALTVFFTTAINRGLGQAANKFVFDVSPRFDVPGLSAIPFVGSLFKNMYPYEFVILAFAIIAWFLIYKTRYGMRMRGCGENPHAVEAAGGNVSKTQFISVVFSGAMAGLGGICFAYSISANFSPASYMGYGYLATAAMIFGNWNIMTTGLACLFFGFAQASGQQLMLRLELSSNFSDLFATIPYICTLLLLAFFSQKSHPPKALGEIYDKGKR